MNLRGPRMSELLTVALIVRNDRFVSMLIDRGADVNDWFEYIDKGDGD